MKVKQWENFYASRTIDVPEEFEDIMVLYLKAGDSLFSEACEACEQFINHPQFTEFREWMRQTHLNWDPSPSELYDGDDGDWGFRAENDEEIQDGTDIRTN